MTSTRFAWLEITGKCQLACEHCYADSGPSGTHGKMRTNDWTRVIAELAQLGVANVQFIGGEPMLHPSLASLVTCARDHNLGVEVFSNLVHVPDRMWPVLAQSGVSLATSYYSDMASEHDAITGRSSHARTRSNIRRARERGVRIRAGVVHMRRGQRSNAAAAELRDAGVENVAIDHIRGVGRGAHRSEPDASELCGQCADGVIAISPAGDVWPCVFARWLPVGNVLREHLAGILAGAATTRTRDELRSEFGRRTPSAPCVPKMCDPECGPSCSPACRPAGNCRPAGGCVPSY